MTQLILVEMIGLTLSCLSNIKKLISKQFIPENYNECQRWLIGRYNNDRQASASAALGKRTAREGGHEYVTATIMKHPLLANVLIAHYFFDNDTSKTFRFRYYEFELSPNLEIVMKLYRPFLNADKILKGLNYDVDKYLPDIITECECIEGCDVVWEKTAWNFMRSQYYNGKLVNGSCKICSQQDPNLELLVKDNLQLWSNELWIADKVYTMDGKQIIGNSQGIPYKMNKMSS